MMDLSTIERESGLTALSSGICVGCETCAQSHDFKVNSENAEIECQNGELIDEPSFSRQPCDLCDSALGGDRYSCHGIDSDNNIVHLEICTDCLQEIG